MRKKLLSWLLVLSMVVSMIPATVLPVRAAEPKGTDTGGVTLGAITQRYDVSAQPADIEITAGGTYELTGSSTDRAVIVKTNAAVTLVLNGLKMEGAKSPIQLQDGANVTLVLKTGTTNSITCTATTVTVTTTSPNLEWTPNPDETEDDRPQITVPGNDGMTAGINVPENATLTIDKVKDETAGELTVQGGYGGAGIGGGAATPGYTEERGLAGATGGGGYRGEGGGGGGTAGPGGSGGGGQGGQGGLFGQNAENAGTVVINAGTLTVTGGENAAGIGGGRGADGQTATDSGKPGVVGGNAWATGAGTKYPASGGGGGSGGNGGNGGNGGTGGSLKALTITGGTVKVTGGKDATGIGGGNGGTGGNGGPGGAGGAGGNGSGQRRGGHGGAGSNGATGFQGASPGGDGGTVKITGGRVVASGYVAVGAGRTEWPKALKYHVNRNAGRTNSSGANGGEGGYNNVNTRPQPTTTDGTLTIQNASVQLLNTLPLEDLNKETASNTDLTQPNNYVRPMNGQLQNEELYHLALTVKRLDKTTICADADINLVLYRGDASKQYTYTTTTAADGVAHLWLPVMPKKGTSGIVKDDYHLYAEGNEIAHRAVGRILKDLAFGIEITAQDNNTLEAYIGVDYTAGTTPNNSKVYRSVDSETYELKPDDTRGVVNVRIDARTVPEDMKITKLRWFRESVALDAEYDFYTHGTKKKFDDRFIEIQTATPGNTGSSNADDQRKGSVVIDMASEQGEAGEKLRIWELPMKENGRYWVELTYQAGSETPQMIVKGVVINNIFTSYPLWVRGFWALGDKAYEPLSWLYGDGGTGANWQTKTAKYMRLLGANKQPQTQPYGIPWDLDGYSAEAMKNSDENYDYATKIIDQNHVFKPTGATDGYDHVFIYATDVLKTLYNAQVGNFSADPDEGQAIALNHGAADNPYELILNADYFSNQTTRYGEKVNGKQLYNKYLVQYLARDGSLNIVLMSGVDEAGEPLYDDIKMFTPEITDADIRAWERPGSAVTKVEYAKADGVWVDITTRKDDLTAENPTDELRIQTDLEGLKAYFSKIEDVKKVRFTYKKSTTDVTIKAYYLPEQGETTEREIEGFVPYPVEATYGKPYKPKGEPTIAGFTYANKSSLKDDGTIDVVDPSTLTEEQRANANVIKYYYVKETGNVTYRAVVKGAGQDGADLTVWSEDKTVARDAAPQTVKDGYTPPLLTNYVISDKNGENGNESITRKDNGNPAPVYDGVHDLYVTYEYVQKTKDITVKAIDVLTGLGIALDEADAKVKTLPTGEYKDITAPDLAAKGYTPVGAATQKCFVDATLVDQTVTFFYKPTENAETTVTLYYMDGANEKTIQVLRNEVAWGSSLKVPAPTIAGYTLDVNQAGLKTETLDSGETKYFVTLNPLRGENGAEATGTSTKILYTKNAPKNVTVKLVDGEGNDLSNLLTGWTGTIEVEDGKSATATAPSIPNYKLAQGETVEKTLKWADIQQALADGKEPTITFTYEKAEADLITITVEGKTAADKLLYSYTKDVKKSADAVAIQVFTLAGYKLDNVKMGTTVVNAQSGAYTIDPAGTPQTVTATYSDNMVDVTIHGYLKDSTEQVFPDVTVSVEKGTSFTYRKPVVSGYDNADDDPNVGTITSVAEGAEITFYYLHSNGNVTYQAVDADGKVLAVKTVTVKKGDTIVTTTAKANDLFNIPYYQVKDAGTADGVVNGKYDGVTDVTVTYQYTRKTQDVTVIKKDVDTGNEIAGNQQTLPALPVGESYSFVVGTVTAPQNYDEAAGRNPGSYFVEDKAGQTVTFWYKNTSDSQYVQVTVNLKCGDAIFQTYPVTAVKDVVTTIKAPEWKGYQLAEGQDEYKPVTPNGTPANDTVTFNYTIKNPKTVTVVLKDNSDLQNPDKTLNMPTGYTNSYTLKEGDKFEIWAPPVDGYTLMSATLGNKASQNKQMVQLDYETLVNGSVVTFRYYPVADANFVTHTIKFMLGDKPLYTYDKMVVKGTGTQVSYSSKDVADMIPGYTFSNISYTVGGKTVDEAEVKDNVNAIITYYFKEDNAQITVKFQDQYGAQLMQNGVAVANQVLTGYRKGQTVQVAAPVKSGFALVGDLVQSVKLNGENTEVIFKYEPAGRVTFTLKELNVNDSTSNIIAVINGEAGKTYDANAKDNNPLDLSKYGYTFEPSNLAAAPFDKNGSGKVENLEMTLDKAYTVFYTKGLCNVEYIPVNKTQLDEAKTTLAKAIKDGTVDKYKIGDLTPVTPERARVGETYKAVAQSFNGWALKDDFSKLYPVEPGTDSLKVYFLYEQKTVGTVTVHYHFGDKPTDASGNKGKLLNEYSIKAVVGEKLQINAPDYLMDNKYHLRASNQTPYILTVTQNTETVDFYYEGNFVTVDVKTVVDGGNADLYDTHEVTKGENNSGSITLCPPDKAGYTLVGITATGTTLTEGGSDKLPKEYTNNELVLKNLTENATVTYHYKTTKASEYQVKITVIEKYATCDISNNTYLVEKERVVEKSHTYAPKNYDGYKVASYQVDDEAKQEITGAFNGAQVDHNQNHTITYTFVRTDGSVTVPGKDEKLPSEDDVTIKPTDPAQKPTVNPDTGTVTVPEGGGTVKTPDGTVEVPKDTTIEKDGTIKTPDGEVIDPSNPGEVTGHYFIQYKPNGGNGESYTKYFKTDAKENLKTVGELFTKSGFTATGWNTYANGNGVPYNENAEVSGKSLTLYAQWKQDERPTGRYTATVILRANGAQGSDVTYTIASNDNDPIREKIKANPFTLDGWTFKGWLTGENSGTYYADQVVAEVKNGGTLTLYAQWIKENEDGSITVPGEDKKPNTTDDVTAKPAPGEDGGLKRDDKTGEITVPNGGSAVNKNGEIDMPNGGTVKPDGTITIKQPDGTNIVVKPDGTTEPGTDGKQIFCLTYHSAEGNLKDVKVYFKDGTTVQVKADAMTREGYKLGQWLNGDTPVRFGTDISTTTELTAKWYKVNDDGSVTVPGKDGSIDPDDGNDNVTVKPGTDGKTPDVDNDSNVVVPPADGSGTGTVTTPDGELVVPGGSKVDPDGTITDPDNKQLYPSTDPNDPDKTPDGYFKVTYKPGESGVDNQKDVIQLVKTGEKATILAGGIFASANKVFIGWKDGDGNVVELTTQLDAETVLTAQWKLAGSVTLEWAKDNTKVQNGVKDGEYKLVMRGEWATTDSDKTDKTYTIPVLVDGKPAADGDLRWYVDAASYKNEFGFKGRLTGDDIVSVDAQTGAITVKNSGIVRIYCESKTNPTFRISVVVIVAGDITKDGKVAMSDINYLYALVDGEIQLPTFSERDHSTWYLMELVDLANGNGKADMSDINALWTLVDEENFI